MSALDILRERGYIQQVSDAAGLRSALERPTTVYCGYDPTRDSLQVGNLVSIMMLAHLQRAGHRPIALIGGGTALIGDPSGKTEMREMLTVEQIRDNARALHDQFGRFLSFECGRALMLNNADWLSELRYIPFLRDIGRHFSVNQLLQHQTYRERLAGAGLNFIELNYALLQAYDFLHLFREHACVLQIGGSDQWFNILAGVDLIHRVERREAFALVSPLVNTASGAKMGKTEAGAVWLDARRTLPQVFYQYWINVEDEDVERFLKLFTFLPLEEITRLGALQGAELQEAKRILAYEVTRLVHGKEVADQVQADAQLLFRTTLTFTQSVLPPRLTTHTVWDTSQAGTPLALLSSVPTTEVESKQLEAGMSLVDALVLAGLARSKTAAKTQIQGGGVYVNGERVERVDRVLTATDLVDGQILLRRGKKQNRRIVVG